MKSSYQARTGHGRYKFSKKNSNGDASLRRKFVIERLKQQLKEGTKPEKNLHPLTVATTGPKYIPLDEKDVKRIKQEIATLEKRV